MKACVVHYTKCDGRTTIASARIAKYLAEEFRAPLVDNGIEARKHNLSAMDLVLFVNSPFLYCDFKEEIKAANFRRPLCVWVQNDYTVDRFPRVDMLTWTNVATAVITFRDCYVNWNLLTYRDAVPDTKERAAGVLYYGAYRAGREKYFQKYLSSRMYDVHISSSAPARKKFAALNENATLLAPFDDVIVGAAGYELSLYIEDEYTHKNFNSPANRFYELLSAGTAIAFDKSCANTFRKAGYPVEPYLVDSDRELSTLLPVAGGIAKDQARWRRDYLDELHAQVSAAKMKLAKYMGRGA